MSPARWERYQQLREESGRSHQTIAASAVDLTQEDGDGKREGVDLHRKGRDHDEDESEPLRAEFKLEAVQLAQSSQKPLTQIAND